MGGDKESGWRVTGRLLVENPNPWQVDATVTELADFGGLGTCHIVAYEVLSDNGLSTTGRIGGSWDSVNPLVFEGDHQLDRNWQTVNLSSGEFETLPSRAYAFYECLIASHPGDTEDLPGWLAGSDYPASDQATITWDQGTVYSEHDSANSVPQVFTADQVTNIEVESTNATVFDSWEGGEFAELMRCEFDGEGVVKASEYGTEVNPEDCVIIYTSGKLVVRPDGGPYRNEVQIIDDEDRLQDYDFAYVNPHNEFEIAWDLPLTGGTPSYWPWLLLTAVACAVIALADRTRKQVNAVG